MIVTRSCKDLWVPCPGCRKQLAAGCGTETPDGASDAHKLSAEQNASRGALEAKCILWRGGLSNLEPRPPPQRVQHASNEQRSPARPSSLDGRALSPSLIRDKPKLSLTLRDNLITVASASGMAVELLGAKSSASPY